MNVDLPHPESAATPMITGVSPFLSAISNGEEEEYLTLFTLLVGTKVKEVTVVKRRAVATQENFIVKKIC